MPVWLLHLDVTGLLSSRKEKEGAVLLFASGSRDCWHCRVDHPCSEIPSEKKEVLGGRELEEGEKREGGRPAVGTGTN